RLLRPGLLHFFKVAWFPASVKGGFFWAVDAEVDKPAFAGDGLDPLVLMSLWSAGAEVEFGRLGFGDVFELEHRAEGSLALVGLDLAAGIGVVDSNGPEELARYRLPHGELVAPTSVESGSGGVAQAEPVERACSRVALEH